MDATSTTTEIITVNGMSCEHCVIAVRQALQKIDHLNVYEVTIGSVQIHRDPNKVNDRQIVEAIEDSGYTANSIKQNRYTEIRYSE